MNDVLIKIGHVESITDDADGLRIKVRLVQDGSTPVNELPYAFPMLPKTFQTVPKVGEAVLVFTSKLNNSVSNRYYLGPIISQPQYQNYDSYAYGRGTALSLLQGGMFEPLEKPSNYASTDGAFPKLNDVALVGRKSEDVILKEGEVDIRCGIRQRSDENKDGLLGEVVFNKLNPSYIQLKYKRGIGRSNKQECDSLINLVADKINIISHKDINAFNLTDQGELIKTSDMDDIMSKLHQLPYGDILVEVLEKIRRTIENHVHPYPGLPPCKDEFIMSLSSEDFQKILSDHVRIS